MSYEVWADPGFDAELSKLPKKAQQQITDGLIAYAANPIRHPKATRLESASVVQSFRIRIGDYRILGTLFNSQTTTLVTTVFRKKRDEDYVAAAQRHEKRLKAQVPPLSDYLDEIGF